MISSVSSEEARTAGEAKDSPDLALDYIFHPRSVAVVGASAEPQKQGYKYVELLQKFGFKGNLFAVNSKGGEVLGLKAFPSLRDLPVPVDYVIGTVPAPALAQLLDDCISRGVKVLQLFTARLGETGKEELMRQEKELIERARKAGIRVLGPNCMGIYYPKEGLSFRFNFPQEAGCVAFISQSAGHAAEMVYRSSLRGVRFSKAISYGNASDINETDFIRYFAQDPETRIIAAYIEGVRGGRRFLAALAEASVSKPVLLYKGGRTEVGGRATASHTGSIAGSPTTWDALCQQSGALQANSVEELVDLAVTFFFMPPPQGNSVGVLGGGGGGSVATADECSAAGLEVPHLPPEIRVELQQIVPQEWDLLDNPLDLSVVATGRGGRRAINHIMRLLCESPKFPLVILDVGAEWLLEKREGQQGVHDSITTVAEANQLVRKPVAVILRSGDSPEEWRWKTIMEEQQRCISAGLAVYPSVPRATRALGKFVRYHRVMQRDEQDIPQQRDV